MTDDLEETQDTSEGTEPPLDDLPDDVQVGDPEKED